MRLIRLLGLIAIFVVVRRWLRQARNQSEEGE